MRYRYGFSDLVRQFLKVELPCPRPASIASTTIGTDKNFSALGIMFATKVPPPLPYTRVFAKLKPTAPQAS